VSLSTIHFWLVGSAPQQVARHAAPRLRLAAARAQSPRSGGFASIGGGFASLARRSVLAGRSLAQP
jgi:hypothetical protein